MPLIKRNYWMRRFWQGEMWNRDNSGVIKGDFAVSHCRLLYLCGSLQSSRERWQGAPAVTARNWHDLPIVSLSHEWCSDGNSELNRQDWVLGNEAVVGVRSPRKHLEWLSVPSNDNCAVSGKNISIFLMKPWTWYHGEGRQSILNPIWIQQGPSHALQLLELVQVFFSGWRIALRKLKRNVFRSRRNACMAQMYANAKVNT